MTKEDANGFLENDPNCFDLNGTAVNFNHMRSESINQLSHLETVSDVSELVIMNAMGHPLFVKSFFATIIKR